MLTGLRRHEDAWMDDTETQSIFNTKLPIKPTSLKNSKHDYEAQEIQTG